MARAPRPVRGWGMPGGMRTTGTSHASASRASSPPMVMATTRAPARAASVTASTVSSVSPEKDTAKTSEPSPTKAGTL